MPEDKAAPLKAMVKDCLPKMNYLDISLDQVLACLHEKPKVPKVALNYDPPPIYYSETPAIMVIYLGQPEFKPIAGTKLTFAVNTNWTVIQDPATTMTYLLDEDTWLMGRDPIKGPWMATTDLPAEFSKLPSDGDWDEVKKHIPGKVGHAAPRVFAATQPSVLIVTNGPPTFTALPGTRLMYVSNPTMPLFWDVSNGDYYYLDAGRWFRAKELTGPWSAASTDLPAEFAKIPRDSAMGYVLCSIPQTQEAEDAVLLASIPHKATIDRASAKVTVAYTGAPKFVAIEGTTMTYAINTGYQVIYAAGQYYCCYNGVWFVCPLATGPWVVCTTVPSVIYTIPPSCPLYNCTYCYVYGSTPTTVYVGYTSGYSGEYVAATGVLMFGAGMMVGAAIASSSCYPCYYSYGCAACYHYGYGGYYRGASCYGPYGGAGYRAGYNPATGNYYRGGYTSGPGGARWGGQAYNPYTNTYSQHTGGTNGYKSWGNSYVQQGNKWAESGHQSNWRGSAGYAENSQGKWAEGAHSNLTDSSIGKTSSGDYYASHDGNVYKSSGDGSWQKYNGDGNWSDSNWNKSADRSNVSSLNSDAWSRGQGTSNAASSWSDRGGGGGFGGGGSDHFGGGGGGGLFGGGGFGGGRFGGGGGFGGGGFGGGRFGGFRR
jgi:hypothetical protein